MTIERLAVILIVLAVAVAATADLLIGLAAIFRWL
jgi:hypothetical protein